MSEPQLISSSEKQLAEVRDFYDAYWGRGSSPKPYDVIDCDIRNRGAEFFKRDAIRKQNDKARQEALQRWSK